MRPRRHRLRAEHQHHRAVHAPVALFLSLVPPLVQWAPPRGTKSLCRSSASASTGASEHGFPSPKGPGRRAVYPIAESWAFIRRCKDAKLRRSAPMSSAHPHPAASSESSASTSAVPHSQASGTVREGSACIEKAGLVSRAASGKVHGEVRWRGTRAGSGSFGGPPGSRSGGTGSFGRGMSGWRCGFGAWAVRRAAAAAAWDAPAAGQGASFAGFLAYRLGRQAPRAFDKPPGARRKPRGPERKLPGLRPRLPGLGRRLPGPARCLEQLAEIRICDRRGPVPRLDRRQRT
jgi:hypothetical protein